MAKEQMETSLTETAHDQIQNMIVTGALTPRQLLSESELARELGCGRTPVREALQRLEFEGFVEILPRRGILVTAVDVNLQLELLETRRPLENLMVTLAARRATDSQREKMRDLAEKLEIAVAENDRQNYLAINKSIHKLQASATHNRFLQSQLNFIHNLSRRFWYSFITDTQSFSKAATFHSATLRAIADREGEIAVQHNNALIGLLDSVTRDAIVKN